MEGSENAMTYLEHQKDLDAKMLGAYKEIIHMIDNGEDIQIIRSVLETQAERISRRLFPEKSTSSE